MKTVRAMPALVALTGLSLGLMGCGGSSEPAPDASAAVDPNYGPGMPAEPGPMMPAPDPSAGQNPEVPGAPATTEAPAPPPSGSSGDATSSMLAMANQAPAATPQPAAAPGGEGYGPGGGAPDYVSGEGGNPDYAAGQGGGAVSQMVGQGGAEGAGSVNSEYGPGPAGGPGVMGRKAGGRMAMGGEVISGGPDTGPGPVAPGYEPTSGGEGAGAPMPGNFEGQGMMAGQAPGVSGAAQPPSGGELGGEYGGGYEGGGGQPGFGGELPGGGGVGGPGADSEPNFRNPVNAVNSFLAAIKSRDPVRLADTVAKRAVVEAVEPNRKLFSAILEQGLSEDRLGELAREFEGMQVIGFSPVMTETAKMKVRVGKRQGRDTVVRQLIVRREKAGWKVLDMEKPRNYFPTRAR